MAEAHEASTGKGEADRDAIVADYRTLLSELALLTTISVLLFGFLLTAALRESRSRLEEWIMVAALVIVASATLIFAMPVVYHRLQFPYENWEKFQRRAHGFITIGFPVFVAGFYLSLTLAVWDELSGAGFAVAGVPLAVAGGLFLVRRRISA
jgi:hypothetical protein